MPAHPLAGMAERVTRYAERETMMKTDPKNYLAVAEELRRMAARIRELAEDGVGDEEELDYVQGRLEVNAECYEMEAPL